MDFGALLHYAKKKNDAATKEEGKHYYNTKYAPPKKESKESKQLSNNIQKFLRKREAEEAERKREEREKLNNLLSMRDEKSKNKIRKMLKVTKSANKSVLEDAKNCDNTDVMNQPESADDYGYVSTEANAFYQKYIEKVKDVQEEKGFAPSRPQSVRDLSGTKERVKAAITREREEAKTHTRQRTSRVEKSSSVSKNTNIARAYSTSSKTLYDPAVERKDEQQRQQQEKTKQKRPPHPPPMDFQALLRLAEKKQHEPVLLPQSEKKKEPERLLSAREKREQEERQRCKERRAERERIFESETKSKDQKEQPARMEPNGRIPKVNSKPSASKGTATSIANETRVKSTSDNLKRPATTATTGSSTAKISAISSKAISATANLSSKPRPAANTPSKPTPSTAAATTSKPIGGNVVQSRNPYAAVNKSGATREFPPRDPSKTRPFPPTTNRKPMPNESRGRGAPPPPAGRKQLVGGSKRRIYDEDDSEYDSELDDFIDDGDCEEDISSHIRNIFGYDKRRYRDLDEDDDRMESSFAQVQREEFISKKLGLQEDLEDMRMEAMHKKRKMAKKRTNRLDDDDDD